MRAAVVRAHGTLEPGELPKPTPGPGEVLVAVKASGVNFADTLVVAGKYQEKPALPFAPGLEAAGEVVECGPGVKRLKIGDRILTTPPFGGFAEFATSREEFSFVIPKTMGFDIAAGFPVTYGTAHAALRWHLDLKPGQTLVVHGAGGGVGLAAVEIGKAMGAHVIACASADDKLEFCRSLGADETVNYSTEDLKTRLKDLTGGKGVDVIYDPVGADLAEQAFRAIGWKGRFLVIGFAGGGIPKMPLNLALLKGADIVGVFWGDHLKREPDLHRANMAQLLDWVVQGKVKPHIHKVYPLDQTADALQAIARREVLGKVIVAP